MTSFGASRRPVVWRRFGQEYGPDVQNTPEWNGLARAFFYAGARALLVSHWAVDSMQ
jgi:CHAT domain-containing protein